MLPATTYPNQIITVQHPQSHADSPSWLDFFNPQAALDTVINHVETLPGSQHERHTMRAYLGSLADFCRFANASVAHYGDETYAFNFDFMSLPTKSLMQDYIASCKRRGLSSATVTRYLAAVRHFLHSLDEQQVTPRSGADFMFISEAQRQFRLAAGVKNPAADRTSNRPALEQYGTRLTLKDVNRLFESFTADIHTLAGKRDLALLYLGITSGLRAAELARLTPANITQGADCYEIRVRGKRNNYDPVSIDSTAYELVQQFITAWNHRLDADDPRRIASHTPIFQPTLRGDHIPYIGLRDYNPAAGISARAILKIVDRRTYDALGSAITAHDMRRTCAFLMRSEGFEWDEIRTRLRHRSIGTTEKYVGKNQNLARSLLSNRINFTVPHDERQEMFS